MVPVVSAPALKNRNTYKLLTKEECEKIADQIGQTSVNYR